MTLQDFTQLGQQNLPYFEAEALRLTKNAEEAKDLLQEAAYWAFRNRGRFQSGTNFRAWATTIIRNTFFSDYRQAKRRRELLAERPVQLEWSERSVTFNPAEGDLGAEKIMEVIRQLPAHFRLPFLLHFQGVKYKDIALRMGTPIGTAKSRVFTARAILKEKITALYQDAA